MAISWRQRRHETVETGSAVSAVPPAGRQGSDGRVDQRAGNDMKRQRQHGAAGRNTVRREMMADILFISQMGY